MIVTHPLLFNIIVILFIAFTSGWVVFVAVGRRSISLKSKMDKLEDEKENLRHRAQELEEQLQERNPAYVSKTPVISFSSSIKTNKTNEAGV